MVSNGLENRADQTQHFEDVKAQAERLLANLGVPFANVSDAIHKMIGATQGFRDIYVRVIKTNSKEDDREVLSRQNEAVDLFSNQVDDLIKRDQSVGGIQNELKDYFRLRLLAFQSAATEKPSKAQASINEQFLKQWSKPASQLLKSNLLDSGAKQELSNDIADLQTSINRVDLSISSMEKTPLVNKKNSELFGVEIQPNLLDSGDAAVVTVWLVDIVRALGKIGGGVALSDADEQSIEKYLETTKNELRGHYHSGTNTQAWGEITKLQRLLEEILHENWVLESGGSGSNGRKEFLRPSRNNVPKEIAGEVEVFLDNFADEINQADALGHMLLVAGEGGRGEALSPQQKEFLLKFRDRIRAYLGQQISMMQVGLNIGNNEADAEYVELYAYYIEKLYNEWLNRLVTVSGAGENKDKAPKKEAGELIMIEAMYNFLREQRNPKLPDFQEVREGKLSLEPAYFMRELNLALMGQLGYLVNGTASSGQTAITLPSSHANMWDGFEIGQRNIQANVPDTIKPTFKFFFENFPWENIVPGLFDEPGVRDRFNNLWLLRIIHYQQMHDFAADIRAVLDPVQKRKDSDEFPIELYQLVGGKGADGGLYEPDMVTFFHNRYDRSKPEERKLAELLADSDGKEIGWMLPDYAQFFLNFISRNLGEYNREKPEHVEKLLSLRDRAYEAIHEAIPPELQMVDDSSGRFRDSAVLDRAWEEAMWRYHITLDIFRHDVGANDTKMPRATETSEYGVKTQPGMSNTGSLWRPSAVESIERAIVYPSDFTYQYARLPESYRTPIESDEDLKAEVEKLKNEALAESSDEAKKPNSKTREYENLKAFYIDLLRRSGGDPITDHYIIFRINQEHCCLKQEGLPVAVPKTMWEHRSQLGADYQDYVPLTTKQVMDSLIDPNLIDYGTTTPNHRTTWATATKDTITWYQLLDLTKPDAVFTPAHDARLTSRIKRLGRVWTSWQVVRRLKDRFNVFANGTPFNRNYAEKLDRRLRKTIKVDKLGSDELAKMFGFAKFTQTQGRYGFAGELTQNAPVIKGQPVAPSPELWVTLFHDEWGGGEVKSNGGNVQCRDFVDLIRKTHDADLAQKTKRTKVRRNVRRAADVYANPKEQNRARNQIIAESLVIAFGAYLDQYRYESHDAREPITGVQNLKIAYGRIKTISSMGKEAVPPLDFAHRELLLVFMVKQMELLQSSGEYKGGLIQNYDREYFVEMMKDRGIIGTQEQAIVDLYYLTHDYEKLSAEPGESSAK